MPTTSRDRPSFKHARDRLFVANAAAQLAGHIDGRDDLANRLEIGRAAVAGAVEIDQVQALGPLADPVPGHRRRVVAEDRFALVVSLPQADALAAAQVDRRPNCIAVT